MSIRNWTEYYKKTEKKSVPRKTLLKAIELFDMEQTGVPKLAIDLGCGSGVDTEALLRFGWSVLAVDAQESAIDSLLTTIPRSYSGQLRSRVASFETLPHLPPAYLINASYSLPFLTPNNFYQFWHLILDSLHPGGRFAGTFFGLRDGWSTRSDMTFLSAEALKDLFLAFEIEFFEEEELAHPDAMGYEKYWHKYFIVAKKTG
ncbi:class I SAM-dependent methyltransferase [Legionella quateirensis]|uniref:SAM-dependent methyltransferase n=1 Tax=Legionella quateirensis TaxID=45072 RepID=A0A378KS00_9GAMM|nr:class I SAM-dependent methyltransferase [Legionella quateirensis]KTD44808.1 SAM-dependent methyltransferase [Legionella quateirensis]STY16267.1 SAM-dependent methyltransferase [Legionella quateirensis]